MTTELETVTKRAAFITEKRAEIEQTFATWGRETQEVTELAGLVSQEITTQAQATDATNAAAWAKGIRDRIESQRKTWTGPILKLKQAIDARCKGLTAELQGLEGTLKARLAGFEEAQERKRQEALRIAQAAQERLEREEAQRAAEAANGQEAPSEPVEAPLPPMPALEERPVGTGRSVRKVWGFKITDPAKLPREYLVPNLALLRDCAKREETRLEIPGVKWTCETSIAIKGQ